MTKVTLHYNLSRTLTEPELQTIAGLSSIFGIERVQVAPALDKLTVDYDASRMMKTDLESVLHKHGLPVV